MKRRSPIWIGAVAALPAAFFAWANNSSAAQGQFSPKQSTSALADKFPGIKLQIPGANISQIFSRPDGGLVIGFTYESNGKLYSGLFDVMANERLSRNLEYDMAHNNQVKFSVLKSKNLKTIYPLSLVNIDKHLSVQANLGDNRCSFPYYDSIVFYINHTRVSSEAILVRLPERKFHKFSCEYAETGLPKPVRVKFEPIVPSFYLDGRHGFYVKSGPYLIHLDRTGHSQFFAGRNDIILLPGGRLDVIAGKAESSNARSWQPFIDQAEEVIETAGGNKGGQSARQ